MATFQAVWQPKSASGGINDSQVVTLAGSGGTNAITVGVRQKVGLTITGPVYVRFSLGANSTATTADLSLPGGSSPGLYYFETGDEFDRLNFLNNNGASTTVVSVMRLSV